MLSEPLPPVEDAAADDEATDDEAEEADAGEETELPFAEPGTIDRFVILLADRTPERTRPLDEVRAQVESSVLAQERAELRNVWINGLRERIPVIENLLAADFSNLLPDDGFVPDEVEGQVDEADDQIDDGQVDEDGDTEAAADDEASGEDAPAPDED